MEVSAMAMRVDGVASEGLRFVSVVSDAADNATVEGLFAREDIAEA